MIEGFWDIEMAARGAFMIWWYFAIAGASLLNLSVVIIILNPKIKEMFN